MTRIGIVGMGGVGGYLGGLLAAYCSDKSHEVEVYFFARETSAKAIREQGLLLDTTHGKYIAHPKAVFTSGQSAPTMDYVIYATKSYSVADSLPLLKQITTPNSVVITFMNGIDSGEILKTNLSCHVWDGCVYIMSHIQSPGVIVEDGGWILYYFGSTQSCDHDRLLWFEQICLSSGIKIRLAEDIAYRQWDKFGYISPLATLATAYNLTNGQIIESELHTAELMALYREFRDVAHAMGIGIAEDVDRVNFEKMTRTPHTMTTSMQRDYYACKPSEYESLTGYIVESGHRKGIPTPTYEAMYKKIKNGDCAKKA